MARQKLNPVIGAETKNAPVIEEKSKESKSKSKKKYIRNVLILSETEKELNDKIYTEVKTFDGKIYLLTESDYKELVKTNLIIED